MNFLGSRENKSVINAIVFPTLSFERGMMLVRYILIFFPDLSCESRNEALLTLSMIHFFSS